MLLRFMLLSLAITAAAAVDLLDPTAYTAQDATVATDQGGLVFKVSDGVALGQARIALGTTYTKTITIRGAVVDAPGIPFGNWTIHLGNAASDKRLGAGYGPGGKETWLGVWNSLHERVSLERVGGATGGTAIEFVITIDLMKKVMTATFGTNERTLAYTHDLPAIDSLWLVSYKQGIKFGRLQVTGE